MSINKEKVFESFSSFLKSPEKLETCKSAEEFLPAEVKLAIQLCCLMNSYNITEEEAWGVYELKENLKIDDLKKAWSIYNEGGIVERVRNSSEDSCFEAYFEQLQGNGWNEENLNNMRRQTVNLINQMSDFSKTHPNELCTALVVGHVQSGKTANYCADINFWIDLYHREEIPYDTFIILTSNNTALGKQTEDRLRKDIIPVRDWCKNQKDDFVKKHGGLLPFRNDDELRTNKKDMIDGNILYYTPHDNHDKCLVAVAIKNKKTIERLKSILGVLHKSSKGILVIDDEADVITPTLSTTGEAAATRTEILKIINNQKCPIAYVAFTATPYATVLNQHPSKKNNPLYPHIAQVLTPSKEYFGSERILGAYKEKSSGQVITIDDFDDDFPESMKNAFAWFICTAAARRIKNKDGQKHQATTMLIHTSKKVLNHSLIQNQLIEYLKESEDIIKRCKACWCDSDGVRKKYTQKDLPMDYPERENVEEFDIEWDVLKEEINKFFNEESTTTVNEFSKGINFRTVNATAKTAKFDFHYPSEEEANYDTVFVTIGGDRIARGLTLTGLTTTYFGRETKYGDTLLQYARWHGYRKGYEVLPRIWMTKDSIRAFKYAAAMEKVSREKWNIEFEQNLDHWEHPLTVACPVDSTILPSGKMKEAIGSMKQASRFQFDTSTVPANPEVWQEVRKITEEFIKELKESEDLRGNKLWKNVSSAVIIEYLNKIAKKYPDSSTFCSWLQDDQIRMLQKNINWNVCFIPLANSDRKPIFNDKESYFKSYFNYQPLRTVDFKHKTDSYFYVKTIRSDISDDVADVDYSGKIPEKNEEIDSVLSKAGCLETPLLRIYLHAPVSDNGNRWLENIEPESNPIVFLSIRRKLPKDIMLSLQVNPAELNVTGFTGYDGETIFELIDEKEVSQGIYCKFTPSNNKTRNTPHEAILLKDSIISQEIIDRLKSVTDVDIEGNLQIDAEGRLKEDITIKNLLAYDLAGILLGEGNKFTKEKCDLWVVYEDDVSLYDLLKGE